MKRIGIICGGYSSEYEISVKSARNVQQNLSEKHQSYLIFLRKEGWFVEVGEEEQEMDLNDFSFSFKGEKIKFDFAIIYIHGNPGENGKIQAYFDLMNIQYVNSGALASELSFDKWYCNQFLQGFNIPVADSIYLHDKKKKLNSGDIISQLKLPIFVKPCDSGSSFGIAKVNSEKELIPAIDNAFSEGETVVLESFLDGVEVTCAVYRSADGLNALPLTEIVSENEFFDYEAKYKGLSDEIIPARISDELTLIVQNKTKFIYNLLKLKSIARVDFMLVNDIPYVIEVNTIPGFSNESIVPKMIAASDKPASQIWDEIIATEIK